MEVVIVVTGTDRQKSPMATDRKQSVKAILTHENPDLDNTLCIWLLRRFGRDRYPGIDQVPVLYVPAGQLPDGLDPDTLERDRGILAVDTGGGRLDTHAHQGARDSSKQDKSASWLVAKDLGVNEEPELTKLLEFVRLQETRARSIASRNPMDHLVCLPNLIRGLNIVHPDSPDRVTDIMMDLYDAAYATERDWTRARTDFKKTATILRLSDGSRVVSLVSDSTAALKVARLHRADLIVHRNSRGHTGITVRSNGQLGRLHLGALAEAVRIAECVVRGQSVPEEGLRDVGTVAGWYLHDSGKILSKGSPKNPTVPPSAIPLDVLLRLAAGFLDPVRGMPTALCAPTGRVEKLDCPSCPFERLHLEACEMVRPPSDTSFCTS